MTCFWKYNESIDAGQTTCSVSSICYCFHWVLTSSIFRPIFCPGCRPLIPTPRVLCNIESTAVQEACVLRSHLVYPPRAMERVWSFTFFFFFFVRHLSEAAVVAAALREPCRPRTIRRRKMPESRPRKTKIQWTNLGARPKEEVVQRQSSTKLNNLVLFDKATYDKLCKEVPNYKLITPAVVSERLKIRVSGQSSPSGTP